MPAPRILASRSISLLPFGSVHCVKRHGHLLLLGGYGGCYVSILSCTEVEEISPAQRAGGVDDFGCANCNRGTSSTAGCIDVPGDGLITLSSAAPGDTLLPCLGPFVPLPVSPLPSPVITIDVMPSTRESESKQNSSSACPLFLLVQFQCGEVEMYRWNSPPQPETLVIWKQFHLQSATSCPSRFFGDELSVLLQDGRDLDLVGIGFPEETGSTGRETLCKLGKPPINHVDASNRSILILLDGEGPVLLDVSSARKISVDFGCDVSPSRSITCGVVLDWVFPKQNASVPMKTEDSHHTPFFLLTGFSDGEVAVFCIVSAEDKESCPRPLDTASTPERTLKAMKLASQRLNYTGIEGICVTRICGREYAFVRCWSDVLHYIFLENIRKMLEGDALLTGLLKHGKLPGQRSSTHSTPISMSIHTLYHTESRIHTIAGISRDCMICGAKDGMIDLITFRMEGISNQSGSGQAYPRERAKMLSQLRSARRAALVNN